MSCFVIITNIMIIQIFIVFTSKINNISNKLFLWRAVASRNKPCRNEAHHGRVFHFETGNKPIGKLDQSEWVSIQLIISCLSAGHSQQLKMISCLVSWSSFSKLFERLMYEPLASFLNEINFLVIMVNFDSTGTVVQH